MPTREQLHKEVDAVPDDQLDNAHVVVESNGSGAADEQSQPGDIIDEWGDLDAQTDAAAGDLMARLDEEEIAEFGETISQAWGYESAK